mmetsp:Transcript_57376/g.145681  ORF Transcript_57376/g.145681 Transcript_57376/m.145681 type:complete len:116 (+) Transcript_57376:1-348(+)
MFTPEADVQSLITPVLRYWGLVTLWKAQFMVMGGMLRGIGLTKLASRVVIAAYWAVSLTLFLFIGFVLNLGLFWMWVGIGLGPLVVLPFYVHAYYYMDYQVLIDERIKKEGKKAA